MCPVRHHPLRLKRGLILRPFLGILEGVAISFPAAKPFKSYVQPRTGHGMNLHFNATGAYDVIQDFLLTEG